MLLFDTLVWTIMGYGAEVWGWKERQEVEKVQERYIRWVLGLDWRTPAYMVREETKREMMRTRAGRRAWNFEIKLAEGGGSEIARKCLEEIRMRERRDERASEWEEERRRFEEERGGERKERGWVAARGEYERIEAADRERQETERWKKIRESRYNRWYREIRTEGVPQYLREAWRDERRNRIARFRLGNEMRGGKYWEDKEKRLCRMCEWEEETWEHVLERCRGGQRNEGDIGERIREILHESGKGEGWMKELVKQRESKRMGVQADEWEGREEIG